VKTLADVELALAMLGTAAFSIRFRWWSNWRNPVGRALLAFTTVLAVLMGLRLWSRLAWPLSDTFWAVGFAALDVVVAALLWRLLRAQTTRPATRENPGR